MGHSMSTHGKLEVLYSQKHTKAHTHTDAHTRVDCSAVCRRWDLHTANQRVPVWTVCWYATLSSPDP